MCESSESSGNGYKNSVGNQSREEERKGADMGGNGRVWHDHNRLIQ